MYVNKTSITGQIALHIFALTTFPSVSLARDTHSRLKSTEPDIMVKAKQNKAQKQSRIPLLPSLHRNRATKLITSPHQPLTGHKDRLETRVPQTSPIRPHSLNPNPTMKSVSPEHRLETHLPRRTDRDKLIPDSVRGVEIPGRDGRGAVPGDVDCVWGGCVLSVRVDGGDGVGGGRLPFGGEGAVVHNCSGLCHVCESGVEDRLVGPVVV